MGYLGLTHILGCVNLFFHERRYGSKLTSYGKLMKLFSIDKTATVKRMGWPDAQLVYITRYKLFGVTALRMTYDANKQWINPLV